MYVVYHVPPGRREGGRVGGSIGRITRLYLLYNTFSRERERMLHANVYYVSLFYGYSVFMPHTYSHITRCRVGVSVGSLYGAECGIG